MKTGYDQYFKDARKAATTASPKKIKLDLSKDELIEKEMRQRVGIKASKRKRKPFPLKMTMVSFVGLIVALLGFQNYEQVEHFIKNVEISVFGSAHAEAQAVKPASAPKSEVPAEAGKKEEPAREAASTAVDMDHLQKLVERNKELDAREEELNRIEQELVAQKAELEKRMKELEEMRSSISATLANRVKADEEKVATLVEMYSSMKAPQAAKVFETMDEDLAVEILGRMKKKNAADIMNLLKPEKTQVFSEKFAGYKKK